MNIFFLTHIHLNIMEITFSFVSVNCFLKVMVSRNDRLSDRLKDALPICKYIDHEEDGSVTPIVIKLVVVSFIVLVIICVIIAVNGDDIDR